MVDPLSASASISGVLSTADVVVWRLYKYIKAVRAAEKEISALSMEITNLYGVLSSLQLAASRFENADSELSLQERTMQLHHIHACYDTLDGIRSLLEKDGPFMSKSRMDVVKRRLHWPLSQTKTKTLTEEVGRHKQNATIALNAGTLSALLTALSRQGAISHDIEDVRNQMMAVSMSDARRRVLRSCAEVVEPHKYLSAAVRLR